ncbi:MAG: hypothetical protein WA705_30715 [Candidatus Ozemobacteraceae bacterium]
MNRLKEMKRMPGTSTRGMTMVEILISCAVLAVFLGGVFGIYRSGARSFSAGSWRATEQKRAQICFSELLRDLEQSSPRILRILADGSWDGFISPVWVNSALYSTGAPKWLETNFADWTCLLAFNITRPFKQANATFSSPLERGQWTGVSLWAKQRQLRYIRGNSPTVWNKTPKPMPVVITDYAPALVQPGTEFVPCLEHIHDTIAHTALSHMAITSMGTREKTVTIRGRFTRFYQGEPGIVFEESITPKLASGSVVKPF